MSELDRYFRQPLDDEAAVAAVFRLLERPAWHREASCRGAGAAMFYPERGEPTGDAKELCGGCPVRPECEEAGLHELYGVWGGTTGRARRGLRKQRKQQEDAA